MQQEAGIPVVTVDYVFNQRGAVISDNVRGMRDLVTYIYNQGHRSIAFLMGGDPQQETREMLIGFKNVLKANGLEADDELIIHTDQEELEQVKQLLTENMEAAVTMQVALKADLNVGENWYELK